MNAMRHALLARQLIGACGGLIEAASACRISRAQLSRTQDPQANTFLPADVIADLEAYCGQALYSSALAESRPSTAETAGLRNEAVEAVQAAVAAMGAIHQALEDSVVTPAEKRDILKFVGELGDQVRQLQAEAEAIETGPALVQTPRAAS